MSEQKPVAEVSQASFGRGQLFWYRDVPKDGTKLFTADQLKAEREKAIREAADIAGKWMRTDCLSECCDDAQNNALLEVEQGILALLSTDESKENTTIDSHIC